MSMHSQPCKSSLFVLTVLLGVLVFIQAARAGVTVRAGDPAFGGVDGWQDTIDHGNVSPLSQLSGPASIFYTSEAVKNGMYGIRFVEPTLVPDIGFGQSPVTYVFVVEPAELEDPYELEVSTDHFGDDDPNYLITSWDYDQFDFGSLSVTGWEYVYDADPNLQNTLTSLAFHVPPGIFSLGLEWIDVNGLSSGFFQRPGQLDFFDALSDPNFDITQVVKIQITVAARNGATIGEPDPTGNGDAWAAFGSLTVQPLAAVPEPSSCLLLGLGTLIVLCGRAINKWTGAFSCSR